MRKIITIIGARPQFIKAATLSKVFKSREDAQEILVHTGQHFDSNMSDVFFDQMGIPVPKYNLNINNLSHGAMTGKMLEQIEAILITEKPDVVVVYGDTNSTLAGALAAAKLHIPVAHIEAGLRSFNMQMPEEINRILTDRISQYLFCPTEVAIQNLKVEGFNNFDVVIENVGDVMYDACKTFASMAKKPNIEGQFVLTTIHRAENTDDPAKLAAIVQALNTIHQQIQVIIPLHPRTSNYLKEYKLDLTCHVIEPVGYLEMLGLLQNASVVITDSGGLQKEAYFHGKACVTVRDQTEWTQLIDCGANELSPTDAEIIVNKVQKALDKRILVDDQLYGDGHAAERIAHRICDLST